MDTRGMNRLLVTKGTRRTKGTCVVARQLRRCGATASLSPDAWPEWPRCVGRASCTSSAVELCVSNIAAVASMGDVFQIQRAKSYRQ